MQVTIFIISFLFIALLLYAARKKRRPLSQPDIQIEKEILQQHVLFYQALTETEKQRFEKAVQAILQKLLITGVKTSVEDMDRVFIAAAAVIPIFAFEGWEYKNIHEVLLYPDSFNEEYRTAGEGRNTSGMVGNGPMQNVMILSQQDLRNGFLHPGDKSNTAIHEFVHLIDKADGDVDGLPEVLQAHKYVLPWLKLIHDEIEFIRLGKSDIDSYGSTSEAEFLAVAAEYFFKQPHLMQQKHPELFMMLEQIFTPSSRQQGIAG